MGTKRKKTNKEDSLTGSILGYLKSHHSFNTFKITEFLDLLNAPTAEVASQEFSSELHKVLTVPKLKQPVRAFAGTLLLNQSKIMNSGAVKSYFSSKKNVEELQNNARLQTELYNQTLANSLHTAVIIFISKIEFFVLIIHLSFR